MFLFFGIGGMGLDLLYAYLVKTDLSIAVDAGLIAAASGPTGDIDSNNQAIFGANFPNQHLGTMSRAVSNPTVNGNTMSTTGTAMLPTIFMRAFGYDALTVQAAATVGFDTSGNGASMVVVIDEDMIDNDEPTIEDISFNSPNCGDSDPSVCINDDIADPGVRELLFTRPDPGDDITPYSGLQLPTGQVGDEGMFYFSNGSEDQHSQQNGATFTLQQFIHADQSIWEGEANPAYDENNLDKIDGVAPMRESEISQLEGVTVCAVVYDSDISVDTSDNYGVLKGATQGLTAFTVTDVQSNGGSQLPTVTIDLIPSDEILTVCAQGQAAPVAGGGGSGSNTAVYLTK